MTSAPADIHVLLVEDDERLARLTARYLELNGLAITQTRDGRGALAEIDRGVYDAVLLDLTLPGKDGLEVCRELRSRHDLPILMVTARTEEADRVLGLEAGADDYLAKPFSTRELLARIRAQVRRARGELGPKVDERPIRVGSLVLSPARRTVTIGGMPVDVTMHEFALLRVLAERPGRVLSREDLLRAVHGPAGDTFDRAIDVQISRLRAKLGDDGRHPRLLKTVRGVGYVLIDETAP